MEFCDWKANWWTRQAREGRRGGSPVVEEGMNAYAARQADQEHRMAETFARKWAVVRLGARFIINEVLGTQDVTGSLPPSLYDAEELISIDVEVDQDDPDQEATMSDFEE